MSVSEYRDASAVTMNLHRVDDTPSGFLGCGSC
jgi:hypothetical protein